MTYEELMSLVGGNNPQSATYQDIISGIQSQYRPQTQFAPTRSLLDSMGTTVADQPRIAYGALLQAQGPRKITPIDLAKYQADSSDMSGGIFDGGGGGGDSSASATSGSAGFSIGPDGLATANTVSQAAATALGIATGMPLGLAASAINAMNVAAANAHNAAMAAEAADAIGSIASNSPAATAGATGTGGAAAAAGTAAAAAASAAGMSDAAAAAAGQAAANATVNGATASEAAVAGAEAAAATDGNDGAGNTGGDTSGSGIAGDNGQSGMGDGVGDGSAWYKGGIVTKNRLIGANPVGQDDGYGALQHGEYVIKKDAVNKYGEEFLGLLNAGKLTKKQINSLL
jgi:hypothetical protein